ncbi:MAG: glycosyltransferase [Chloroflexi bacterium]|nr:glycosyltransferase [Chloroflexota bacterium]
MDLDNWHSGKEPKLTIGLPVYNGERYLCFAIDSLLAQTYSDFELLISDNASTDGTMLICQEYAARDPRIRYFRNMENIGAAANFNKLFQLSRGEYFKWAAADDVISPTFIEKCMEKLESDRSIILAYSKVNRIDSSGEVDGVYDYPMRVDAADPHTRFSDLILVNHFCVAIFGVIRREVLEQTPLIGKYVGSDRVLLAELGLRGRLYEIPEYLFHRRDHPQASGRMFKMYKRLAWFDPAKEKNLNLVYWKIGSEYLRSVHRVDLPWKERLECYRAVIRWFIMRRRSLVEDMKAAVIQLVPFSKSLIQTVRRLQGNRRLPGGGI